MTPMAADIDSIVWLLTFMYFSKDQIVATYRFVDIFTKPFQRFLFHRKVKAKKMPAS